MIYSTPQPSRCPAAAQKRMAQVQDALMQAVLVRWTSGVDAVGDTCEQVDNLTVTNCEAAIAG